MGAGGPPAAGRPAGPPGPGGGGPGSGPGRRSPGGHGGPALRSSERPASEAPASGGAGSGRAGSEATPPRGTARNAPRPDAGERRDNSVFEALLRALARPDEVRVLPEPGPESLGRLQGRARRAGAGARRSTTPTGSSRPTCSRAIPWRPSPSSRPPARSASGPSLAAWAAGAGARRGARAGGGGARRHPRRHARARDVPRPPRAPAPEPRPGRDGGACWPWGYSAMRGLRHRAPHGQRAAPGGGRPAGAPPLRHGVLGGVGCACPRRRWPPRKGGGGARPGLLRDAGLERGQGDRGGDARPHHGGRAEGFPRRGGVRPLPQPRPVEASGFCLHFTAAPPRHPSNRAIDALRGGAAGRRRARRGRGRPTARRMRGASEERAPRGGTSHDRGRARRGLGADGLRLPRRLGEARAAPRHGQGGGHPGVPDPLRQPRGAPWRAAGARGACR